MRWFRLSQSKPVLNLGFQHHHLDQAKGQNYWKLYAYDANTPNWAVVGYLDYSDFGGKIYVDMVFVNPEFRRIGIGTALMRELERKAREDGMEIVHGMQTEEGAELVKSLGKSAARTKKLPVTEHGRTMPEEDEDLATEQAERYFDIGHDHDEGKEAGPNMVWILYGREIWAEPETSDDDRIRSHGTIWGHDVADKTWKGRYDGTTGEISVVSPNQFSSMPSWLRDLLIQKFSPTSFHVF